MKKIVVACIALVPHVCDSHAHPPVDWKNLSHAERAELTIEHLYRRVGDTPAV